MSLNSKDTARIGRALVFIHQNSAPITDPTVRAQMESLLTAGRAMDFVARIHGIPSLTETTLKSYATFAGIGERSLFVEYLPILKSAGVVDYNISEFGNLVDFSEFVGVTGTVLGQAIKVLDALNPSPEEFAILNSVELGSAAPLASADHLEQLTKRGIADAVAQTALDVAKGAGLLYGMASTELGDEVVFSPYVWGTRHVNLASFLHSLPTNEREALLAISGDVLTSPGIHSGRLSVTPDVLRGAEGVGLVQTATVKSDQGASSKYVFSPLMESQDDKVITTEAFHQRKLFVAHILFGQEKAKGGKGVISSPVTLVNALVNRGRVGSATNIRTDYYLLEAAGVVTVTPDPDRSDRAFLDLAKPEIAEAGLEWLKNLSDDWGSEKVSPHLDRAPHSFVSPEESRASISGATNELMKSSILSLREEVQNAARRDDPWS
jgi:hypothetical protein